MSLQCAKSEAAISEEIGFVGIADDQDDTGVVWSRGYQRWSIWEVDPSLGQDGGSIKRGFAQHV